MRKMILSLMAGTVLLASFPVPLFSATAPQPKIGSINLEGNTRFTTKKLLSAASLYLWSGKSFGLEDLTNGLAAIRIKYSKAGYPENSITANTNRGSGKISIRILISEGPRFEVRDFIPEGFTVLKKKALRSSFRIKKLPCTFNAVSWASVRQSTLKKYLDAGYFSARLDGLAETNVVDPAKVKILVLRLAVEEGPRYRFSDLKTGPGNPALEKAFRMGRQLLPGAWLHYTRLTNDLALIRKILDEQDHPFPIITIRTEISGTTAGFKLVIDDGPVPRYAGIRVSGLTKTHTNVILGENLFVSGEPYDYRKKRNFIQALEDSSYFRDIRVKTLGTNNNGEFVLDCGLTEQQTGLITLGATLGVDERGRFVPGGYEEIAEWNLLGRGIKFAERIEVSTVKQYFGLGFQSPRLLRYPVMFNCSPFYSGRIHHSSDQGKSNESYILKNTGLMLGAVYRRANGFQASANLKISAFQGSGSNWPYQSVAPVQRWHMKNSLFLQVGYVDIEGTFFNRSGLVLQQTWIMTGGLLGGVPNFNKWITDVQFYRRIAKYLAFSFKANVGTVTPNLLDGSGLIFGDDFFNIGNPSIGFVGGTSLDWTYFNIPEYNIRTVVPLDRQFGLGKAVFNFEGIVPVSEKLLSLVCFFDAGNIWDGFGKFDFNPDHYYFLAGAGFKLNIPLFPIQLYWSKRFKGLSFVSTGKEFVFDVGMSYLSR